MTAYKAKIYTEDDLEIAFVEGFKASTNDYNGTHEQNYALGTERLKKEAEFFLKKMRISKTQRRDRK